MYESKELNSKIKTLDIIDGIFLGLLAFSIFFTLLIYTLYILIPAKPLILLSLLLSTLATSILILGKINKENTKFRTLKIFYIIIPIIIIEYIIIYIITSIDISPTFLFPDFNHIYNTLIIIQQTFPLFTQTYYIVYTSIIIFFITTTLNISIEEGLYFTYLLGKFFLFTSLTIIQLKLLKLVSIFSQFQEFKEKDLIIDSLFIILTPILYISGTPIRDLYLYYLAPHTLSIVIFGIVLIYIIEYIFNPTNKFYWEEITPFLHLKKRFLTLLKLFVLFTFISNLCFIITTKFFFENIFLCYFLSLTFLVILLIFIILSIHYNSKIYMLSSLLILFLSTSIPEASLIITFLTLSLLLTYIMFFIFKVTKSPERFLVIIPYFLLVNIPIFTSTINVKFPLFEYLLPIVSLLIEWLGVAMVSVQLNYLNILTDFYSLHLYVSFFLYSLIIVIIYKRISKKREPSKFSFRNYEASNFIVLFFLFNTIIFVSNLLTFIKIDEFYRALHYFDFLFTLFIIICIIYLSK